MLSIISMSWAIFLLAMYKIVQAKRTTKKLRN